MSKLAKAIASLCFIYDVNFIILVEEHGLSVGEELCEMMDFVLADPLHNVQRDRNGNHTEYGVLDLNDMK